MVEVEEVEEVRRGAVPVCLPQHGGGLAEADERHEDVEEREARPAQLRHARALARPLPRPLQPWRGMEAENSHGSGEWLMEKVPQLRPARAFWHDGPQAVAEDEERVPQLIHRARAHEAAGRLAEDRHA